MDSVSDMHPVMMLMSYAETDVPAEVVSGTDGSSFAPLPAFMDTILANYKWMSVAKLVNRKGPPLVRVAALGDEFRLRRVAALGDGFGPTRYT